jgi:hypothetical protein
MALLNPEIGKIWGRMLKPASPTLIRDRVRQLAVKAAGQALPMG